MPDYGGARSLGTRVAKQQPDKHPDDGDPTLSWSGHMLTITDGKGQAISLSGFNAWRVFGMLSLMLGLPLQKRAGKLIRL